MVLESLMLQGSGELLERHRGGDGTLASTRRSGKEAFRDAKGGTALEKCCAQDFYFEVCGISSFRVMNCTIIGLAVAETIEICFGVCLSSGYGTRQPKGRTEM